MVRWVRPCKNEEGGFESCGLLMAMRVRPRAVKRAMVRGDPVPGSGSHVASTKVEAAVLRRHGDGRGERAELVFFSLLSVGESDLSAVKVAISSARGRYLIMFAS